MKRTTSFFTWYVLSFCVPLTLNAADLIIFSYNRPLQLEALLCSIQTYVKYPESISVIYRAKGEPFKIAYDELKRSWPNINFYLQENPPDDFKPMLLNLLKQLPSPYVCFAVDDNIVTDQINLKTCVQTLAQTDAFGFYLRLGKNITYSYNYNIQLTVPDMKPIADDIYQFSFTGNKSYWAYPNTVDMTIYKKPDIIQALEEMKYSSPNTLEALWNRQADLKHTGLCHGHSKMVNTPLNIVQENWQSKHDDTYSTEELLTIWQQGLRIDITTINNLDNNAAHINYFPHFIKKDHYEA